MWPGNEKAAKHLPATLGINLSQNTFPAPNPKLNLSIVGVSVARHLITRVKSAKLTFLCLQTPRYCGPMAQLSNFQVPTNNTDWNRDCKQKSKEIQ